MKKSLRNVRVIAANNGNRTGFNIYLDYSGRMEFVAYHRHNGLLYNLLKDGVRADTLRRLTFNGGAGRRRIRNDRCRRALSHLMDVVDAYDEERNAE